LRGVVVPLIADIVAVLSGGADRGREMGLYAAVGRAPPGRGRMALTEAGARAVIGSVLGTISATGALAAMLYASVVAFGQHTPLRLALTAPLVYGIVALAVVLAGAALPAWRT